MKLGEGKMYKGRWIRRTYDDGYLVDSTTLWATLEDAKDWVNDSNPPLKQKLKGGMIVMANGRELSFKDLSPTAKKGIQKFAGFSSAKMKRATIRFKKETGLSGTNVNNKEKFYKFIAKKKFR